MHRITLGTVIPPLLVLILAGLFLHSWTAGPPAHAPAPTTAAWREAQAPGAATGASSEPPAASSVPPPAAPNPEPTAPTPTR